MSSVSLAIQTPTSFTTAFTAISTIVSTVVTSIQSAPVLTPTATTTGHIPKPSMTTNSSSDSSNSSSPAPKPWVSEPYNSGTSFLAAVANIFHMFVYTLPSAGQGILGLFLWSRNQKVALAKEAEEKSYRIQQTEGINKIAELMQAQGERSDKMLELMATMADDNKALKEDNKALRQAVEKLETESKATKEDNAALRQRVENLESRVQGMEEENKPTKADISVAAEKGAKDGIKGPLMEVSQAKTEALQVAIKEAFQDALKEANPPPREATKGLIEGMDRMTDSMRSVVTAVQGLKRVFRVGLEAVDNSTRALDHKVDWMLDYYLDENERFHTLKVVLQGLFDLVGSTSPTSTTATNPHSSWGGDPVKNEIVVDKSGWEEKRDPW